MYKVTIEGGHLKEPMVLEYEYVNLTCERGSCLSSLEPNGHSRANMQLWSGCETYEGFIATGETWEPCAE